ncbi:MAG: tetratricopeptide repeat protein [Bacteroidales bacterium]|jgi:hypothetical protein|nr:tetratricopeptide repeat protein [Bacteroidales bacterium]
MNNRHIIIISLLAAILFFSCDEKRNTFRKANDLYNEKDYKKAEKEYRRVLTMDSAYSKAFFNLANANYRQNDTNSMQLAMDNWQKAYDLQPNEDLLSKSYSVYNQGNVKFKQAIANIDIAQAKDYSTQMIDYGKLKEAADDYKKVLRQFPEDSAARYNLSLINYLISKQQQNKNQNQQQQKQQQNQQQQQNNQQPQPQSQQPQPQQTAAQKNKEQINSMLEALKNNEKNTLRKLKKNEKQQPNKRTSDKDW